MPRNRNNKNPFDRADGREKSTPYALLSDTQAKSKIYRSLKADAKHVYMICKLCRKYHTGRDRDGKSKAIQGNLLYFYFNRAVQQEYGLNNPNKVRKCLIELVEKGFIDVIECNGTTRKRNIYAYSDKWYDLEKGRDIKLSQAAQTFIQGRTIKIQ